MKYISKIIYKPRYFGYFFLKEITKIIDSIFSLILLPLKRECLLYDYFCDYNLRKDIERRKIERLNAKNKMLIDKSNKSF